VSRKRPNESGIPDAGNSFLNSFELPSLGELEQMDREARVIEIQDSEILTVGGGTESDHCDQGIDFDEMDHCDQVSGVDDMPLLSIQVNPGNDLSDQELEEMPNLVDSNGVEVKINILEGAVNFELDFDESTVTDTDGQKCQWAKDGDNA